MFPLSTGPVRRLMTGVVALGALGAVVLAAGSAGAAPADGAPAPDYDGLTQALKGVVAAGSPGAFARVSDAGSADHSVGAGTGDLSTNSPVNLGGQFRVGSITKNFTAVLVLQLVAQHKVDLDAPAAGYLPTGVLPADSPITVRELLDHRSGLYDYTNDILAGPTIPGYQDFRYKVYDPKALVAQSLSHGSQFTPGSQYGYSNTNFVVLGLLVQQLTGKPYAQVLSERILAPLGLTHTRFVVPKVGIGGPHAIGYLTDDDRTQPMLDATDETASWIWTAGAAISSTADLNAYWRALTGGKLLPAAQLAEMEDMQPVDSTSGYGLGMRQYTLSCGTQVDGHDGIVEGYQTYSYSTQDGSRQVTVSANASNNSDIFAAERLALDPVFCGKPATTAAKHASTADATRVAAEEAAGRS